MKAAAQTSDEDLVDLLLSQDGSPIAAKVIDLVWAELPPHIPEYMRSAVVHLVLSDALGQAVAQHELLVETPGRRVDADEGLEPVSTALRASVRFHLDRLRRESGG